MNKIYITFFNPVSFLNLRMHILLYSAGPAEYLGKYVFLRKMVKKIYS